MQKQLSVGTWVMYWTKDYGAFVGKITSFTKTRVRIGYILQFAHDVLVISEDDVKRFLEYRDEEMEEDDE
jgi:hypothetical protein